MVPGSNIVSVSVGCLLCIYEYMFFDCLQNVIIRIDSTAETMLEYKITLGLIFCLYNCMLRDRFGYVHYLKEHTHREYAQHVRRWLRVR